MKALIIGSGAIGSFYGSLLARQGAEVAVQARSDYATVKAHGIDIESQAGVYRFRPAHVVRSGAELPGKPDYVLLCVKVAEGVDRVGLLRDALGPDTAIVLVCNGIDIEAEIAAAYPQHEIISALAFICVNRTAPGKICHQAYGRLTLGNYPAGLSDKARALCAAFERSGIPCNGTLAIRKARWQKCVWNAAFNPLSVLSGGLDTTAILSAQEAFIRQLMAEVCALAEADGHPLPADIIEQNIDSTRAIAPYQTSMLLDFLAGRPLETEAILGNAVRHGQRLSVAIPHLESVYALMKLRELQLTRAFNPAATPPVQHRLD